MAGQLVSGLRIDGVAKEGDGVGRDDGGRVTFVRGALPGELVDVEIIEAKKTFARARLTAVVEPSPGRVRPPCPVVTAGCGGCDLQHADGELQRALKLRIVGDAFARIGGFELEPVWGGAITPFGYRTTARCMVIDGVAGFRRYRSHEHVPAAGCLTVHPAVAEIIAAGRFGAAKEVVIRASAATGERIVAVAPEVGDVAVPDDVVVVGADRLGRDQPALVERIAGREWSVSIGSFLQASPAGAELLVATVGSAVDTHAPDAAEMVDLYSGIGLLAGTVGRGRSVAAVEVDPQAVHDAAVNLEGVDHDVRLVRSTVEDWSPTRAAVVVADPPRVGLGRAGVAAVDATGASTVVLVSCDAAAGARDVRALADRGFSLVESTVLDLFPQTAHVEVVSTLARAKGTARSVLRRPS